ncbi:DUF2147 domain-containing protein [Flavobacterium urumqiense]|uniref:Uncharacterized conserved protein, DUF2147 family n=1 Tax=Flavobacterium urumqiense TaxID=935224 RepID=A0A1H5YYE8_9FLAO|nr:DUF2147 domain-containing protein [Flavobacterium urumqiense]SEG29068.1 Uncharacterized conserved protein, DUF2147 family [Flavobacterium urumqiense]
MKNNILIVAALFFTTIFYAQNQTVIGKWKTIDDETGKAKSIVEIYEKSGKIYGKVVEILDVEHKNNVCSECSGSDKNKPILGMIIIKGLTKEGVDYTNGKILDPKNGKSYKCTVTLESKDKLKVRGFVGISLFGRTQYWYRAK